ncbi:MAG: amidohydrolase family protein [Planctomycetaceae bacterium]
MQFSDVRAIDVHGHYGVYERGGNLLARQFMSASLTEVAERAARQAIDLTIVSPLSALLPRGGADVVAGNAEAFALVRHEPRARQYVVIDPRLPATFTQAEQMLATPQCVGIKIHPEEHVYPVAEWGRRVFEFAARWQAVILAHTSEANSLCADMVGWADEFPEIRLILAHIGHGVDGDYSHQVRGVQASRRGNVWADTSSARSITPGLIEWAVREVGPERVLFGSDTPLYHCGMHRARIELADLPVAHQRLILRDNALALFGDRLGISASPTSTSTPRSSSGSAPTVG